MANNSQWVLFGIDLRLGWHRYMQAWRDVFFDHGSPLREALDEPVRVQPLDGSDAFNVGTAAKTVNAQALLLPETQVLTRTLVLPSVSEANLTAIVQAEVIASSPFPTTDTAFGWRLLRRSDKVLTVALVIISKSGAANAIHKRDPELSLDEHELWAQVDDIYLVIEGFGETKRNQRYRRRLGQFTLWCGLAVLCLLALAAVPGVYKAHQLEQLEEAYTEVNRSSRQAVEARSALARQNELLDHLNSLTQATTNPVYALDRITRMLEDDVWISRYIQKGRVVEIDGHATNAAELMQELSNSPEFDKVEARSGFRQAGNTGLERFQLEVTFALEPDISE